MEIRNEIVTLVSVSFGKLLGVTPAVSTGGFLMWITFIWKVTKTLLSLIYQKRNKMKNEVIKKQVEKITETPAAILVILDGLETWLPKSQVHIVKAYSKNDLTILQIEIPEWLYYKL